MGGIFGRRHVIFFILYSFSCVSSLSSGLAGVKSDFSKFSSQFSKMLHDEPLLLDVRSRTEFCEGHLRSSCGIPASELEERLYELPAPFEQSLKLIGGPADRETAKSILEGRGWDVADEIDEAELRVQDLEAGPVSMQAWQPNIFLRFCMDHLDPPLDCAALSTDCGAYDLGCGNGRDAVFMSQRLPSWTVVGIDNHKGALSRARTLSHSHRVHGRTKWVDANLRGNPVCLQALLSVPSAGIVHGHRFMDRNLITAAKKEIVPGGYFMWSTFMGAEAGTNLAPPHKPSRMIASGELARVFGDQETGKWEVILDEESTLITRGLVVPASFFLARKCA
jgi:SAM-dependent methyltransferase